MRVISQDGTMDFPYEMSTIFTHELADENIQNEIHDKSKADFIKLCTCDDSE